MTKLASLKPIYGKGSFDPSRGLMAKGTRMKHPIKPLTAADLKAARSSLEKIRNTEGNPAIQATAVCLWVSVWAEPLMATVAKGLMMTADRERKTSTHEDRDPDS